MKKLINGGWLCPFFPEISLKMKLTTILLIVSLLKIQANTYSQNTKLTLDFKDSTIGQVFNKIESISEFRFLYESQQIDLNRKVTVQVENKKIADILALLFKGTNVKYKTNDRQIILTTKETRDDKPINFNTQGSLQTIKINGNVTDEKGLPLPGVNILEKNTSNGTQTDFEGNYTIAVTDNNSILVFSYVGYLTQEINVGSQTSINITLKEDVAKLDEVVVIGYGTMKKSDLTGSVSSISSDDFNRGAQISAQQLVQGKISGVNISLNSGKPGGATTVRVRGGTSISASNDPLYVIDGVPISTTAGVGSANIQGNGTDFFDQEPTNPLMTLNPNDIESINVLKDASATAIYGSRGANGVIMITTKKGKAGKVQVTYDVTSSLSNVANTLDVLSADEYRKTVSNLGYVEGTDYEDLGANTDWQDLIYRTAFTHEHYLALSGGNDKTNYRVSLGYGKQEGVMLASNLERANSRVNILHEALNGKLKFDLRMNYGQNTANQSPVSNTVGSEAGSSMNYEAYVFNPTYPVKDANGNYYHVLPYRINPVSFSTDIIDERINRKFLGNLATTYQIIDPLSIKVNIGYTNQGINRNSYISKNNPLGEGYGGYASVQKLEDYSKLIESFLSYKDQFGKIGVDAIAGYSYQYFFNEGLRNVASGFLSDEFRWYSLQAASTIQSVTSFAESNTLISMYGRLNLNIDDRFLITGTLRRDGSSRFGSGNKWGLFPSGAISWRLTQEDFFNSSTISDLKLRASYGVTGNQEIGNYQSLSSLSASSSGYIVGGQRLTVVLPSRYANPDLKWEQTSQLNFGVNFGLLDQRIYGSLDYYYKKTSDLLLSVAIPSPSIVSTQLANVGSVENKGFEFELGAHIIDHDDFAWTSDFNLSLNRNKVLSLSNDTWSGDDVLTAPIRGQGLSGGFAQIITEGKPIGTFYGKVFKGIENGIEVFEDNPDYIGSAQPDFTFGLSNNFSYKNWGLVVNLRGSVGNDVYNLTANNLGYLINLPGRNALKSAVESGIGINESKQYSSRWIEDGSYLRMDNVTLSYNFDLHNTFLSNAKVYLSGQNLFVITGYSGLDPEVNSEVSGNGVAPLGIDYLSYPRARTFTLGAAISF